MASSALIDDLLKQFAENPRRVFARLANEYRKRGELDTAIEICRAHVPLQPTYISGYIVLGQALYETGQLDEARSTFETALGLDPENLIGLRQLGDIARAKGDLDGARGWYRRLLEVDPQNAEVEAVLREIDAPAAEAPAASPADAAVSWNDIHPEAHAPSVAAEPVPVPAMSPAEPPAAKSLDFDYDVLSAFGEAESKPAAEEPAPVEATHEAESPTAVEPEPMRAPAPVVIPAPAPVEEPEAASDEPLPAAFITAELYLQQGHREQALDIYRLLLAQRPSDVSLLNRIARLQQPAPAAPSERTVRAFFGRFAHRRPPGLHAESEPVAYTAPAVEEPAPFAPAADVATPLGLEEPAAPDEPSPLGQFTDTPESVEAQAEQAPAAPVAEPEALAIETADTWASIEPAPHPEPESVVEEPAAETVSEPETMAESPTPVADAAPVSEEPSIADFAPAEPYAEPYAESYTEPQAEAQVEPEPAAAAAEVPNESTDTPAHTEPVGVGDYTPEHGRSMSFAELFAGRATGEADERAAAALASAYGTESGVPNGTGHTARAAADALSLDDVFGGGAHEHENAPATFDEFFSARDAGQSASAPESASDQPAAPSVTARRADDADLELFHQWLEGLKK
jgi:tetratricopeptide (TPR) repeat protein